MKRFLITISGKDKPGIIARVSGLLYDQGCNLEDISMTLLEGQFAMMMTVCIPGGTEYSKLREALSLLGSAPWSMEYFVTGLKGKATRGKKHARGCQPCVITAFGRDRTGIVHGISTVLAGMKINITDLDCRILGHGVRTTYAMILEVDVPGIPGLKTLKKRLDLLSKKLKIEIRLRALDPLAF